MKCCKMYWKQYWTYNLDDSNKLLLEDILNMNKLTKYYSFESIYTLFVYRLDNIHSYRYRIDIFLDCLDRIRIYRYMDGCKILRRLNNEWSQ